MKPHTFTPSYPYGDRCAVCGLGPKNPLHWASRTASSDAHKASFQTAVSSWVPRILGSPNKSAGARREPPPAWPKEIWTP